jgi:hypothetical protein
MTSTIDTGATDVPTAANEGPPLGAARFPLLTVLHPRRQTALVAVTGTLALVAAWVARTLAGWVLWQAVALVLAVMVVPASITWRATARRYGLTAAIAGALVTVQGLHSIEHGVQWVQRHVMHQPLRLSNGLLSPANSEWVHFVWNWLVLLTVIVLFVRGMRGWWGWAILLFATAHTLEHTYMWVRFLQVSAELRALGQGDITAQGLPGVVGRGGWLDLNAGPRLDVICGMPFVTNADRLDTHFAWNTGEVLLLLPAVHVLLRQRRSDSGM